MSTVMVKIVEWLFGKNRRERDGVVFYFKSLSFLILIVVFVSDIFWNMSGNIINLLNAKTIKYIVEISNIGIHFFTSLAIISFAVFIVAAIVSELARKFFDKYANYFDRMRLGAEFRLTYSVEDTLLLLMITYMFDKNVLDNYISIYSEPVLIILGIICIFHFSTSSIKGIINHFFMLRPYEDDDKK